MEKGETLLPRIFRALTAVHHILGKLRRADKNNGSPGKRRNGMVSQALKTAVVIILASAVLPTAAVTSQAQDLTAGTMALTSDGVDLAAGSTLNIAATEAAGSLLSHNKSGTQKPPVPETGISALLITGVLMIGFAVRKQTVAA
jgi:hypothetical protein